MPRKPKSQKRRIAIVVNGKSISVTLHPPTKARKSWYVFWNGLTTSKSTGQSDFDEATKVAENMLRNGGKTFKLADTVLSDAEFELIQRRHYDKKTDLNARERSLKSLRECLDAISAFKLISGVTPISLATPHDCEKFQIEAISKSKNWRRSNSNESKASEIENKEKAMELLSSNTVLKWSVALQAAFERACREGGKKCVRGVVPDEKLIPSNPWKNFTWIEGSKKKKRHFDHSELLSLLDYFETNWPGLKFAPAFVKVCVWSWARRLEVSKLRWSDVRCFNEECHFETEGKWGVTKWFRIPDCLHKELADLRTEKNEYVFGCYPDQLRDFLVARGGKKAASRIRHDFVPANLGEWMYREVAQWSKNSPNGNAYLHVFRKTSLQFAVSSAHIEQAVADDASVSSSVMMASYANIREEELRHMSNRTFRRIRSSLSSEVAVRYGWDQKPEEEIIEQLDQARLLKDWDAVTQLAAKLQQVSEKVSQST